MDLKALYPEVREWCQKILPQDWGEYGEFVSPFLEDRQEIGLALAACWAVEGLPRDAVPVAAAIAYAGAGFEIMDDLADHREGAPKETSRERARYWNMALAAHLSSLDLLRQSGLPDLVRNRVFNAFFESYFPIIRGHDLDIKGRFTQLEDYWKVLEWKTAMVFGTAAACGTLVGTDQGAWVQAAGIFGHHFGMCIHIQKNLKDVFSTSVRTNPSRNELALPLLYSLKLNHPNRIKLNDLIEQNALEENREQVIAYLREMGADQFLNVAAEKERAKALEALAKLPDTQGRKALEAYMTEMLAPFTSAS